MNLDSGRPMTAPTGAEEIFNQTNVGAGLCARPFQNTKFIIHHRKERLSELDAGSIRHVDWQISPMVIL